MDSFTFFLASSKYCHVSVPEKKQTKLLIHLSNSQTYFNCKNLSKSVIFHHTSCKDMNKGYICVGIKLTLYGEIKLLKLFSGLHKYKVVKILLNVLCTYYFIGFRYSLQIFKSRKCRFTTTCD